MYDNIIWIDALMKDGFAVVTWCSRAFETVERASEDLATPGPSDSSAFEQEDPAAESLCCRHVQPFTLRPGYRHRPDHH